MAGGAQAADLAVAAPGGVCADGWIAVSGWCLQVGIRVREILSVASDGTVDADTKVRTVFRGMMPTEWGDAGVQVPFEAEHFGAHELAPGVLDNRVHLVDGTFVYVGGFQAGWFNNPGPGGLFSDNDSFHPDNGNNNAAQYTFGNVAAGALTLYVSQADTYVDGNYILAAGWAGSLGGASVSINGGWVGRDVSSGWGANVGVTIPMGGAKFKVVAAYSNNAPGFATNHGLDIVAPGTVWVADATVQIPLGAINTLAGGVAYENFAGAVHWQAVADLIQQWNPVIQTREEITWDSVTSDASGFIWIQGAVGNP